MNINNLYEDQVIKNYTELCSLLEIKATGGDSKKSQHKQLECYCKYHKEGHKYIIDKIYNTPLPYIDERLKSNEYVEEIGDIILEYLFNTKDTDRLLSLSNLMKILGIVNNTYCIGYNNKKELSSVLSLTLYDVNYFYDNTRNEFKKIIERALNNLKSRKVLEWYSQIVLVRKYYNEIKEEFSYTYDVATDDQIKEIINIEKEVMQQLGCRNGRDVFLKRLSKKLYSLSSKRIQEKYNKDYISYFRAYKLLIGDRAIKIEYDNIQVKRYILNNKIINKSEKLLKGYKHKELITLLIDLLKHDLNLDEKILELKDKNYINRFMDELKLSVKLDNIKEKELQEIENKYSDEINYYTYIEYINNLKDIES